MMKDVEFEGTWILKDVVTSMLLFLLYFYVIKVKFVLHFKSFPLKDFQNLNEKAYY